MGPIFEGFVASEIAKLQSGRGLRREIYYFRDQQGLEVDFVIPRGADRLLLIEAKASQTLRPEMGEPLVRLAKAVSGARTESVVVYRRPGDRDAVAALRPGVRVLDVGEIASVVGPTA